MKPSCSCSPPTVVRILEEASGNILIPFEQTDSRNVLEHGSVATVFPNNPPGVDTSWEIALEESRVV